MTVETQLVKAEIDRIRQEEEFRKIVQQELGSSKKPEKSLGLWSVLNSSFGLWLLSTVFITMIGGYYTNHQNQVKALQVVDEAAVADDKVRLARIDRLAMEFSYRFSATLIRLEAAQAQLDRSKSLAPGVLQGLRSQAFAPLTAAGGDASATLYPEFKDRSGLALIAELSTITEGVERADLKYIITRLSGIVNNTETGNRQGKLAFQSIAGTLLNKVKHQRWETGFYYLDCSPEKPFC